MNNIINIDMIIIARKSRGETQASLSKKTGVPQSSISKIEQGLLYPSETVLQAIAQGLKYPVSFFYEEAEFCTPTTIQYRKKTALGEKNLDKILAEANIIMMQLNKLISHKQKEGKKCHG
jgi:transcriptional regulator with XRE-family HTH domain